MGPATTGLDADQQGIFHLLTKWSRLLKSMCGLRTDADAFPSTTVHLQNYQDEAEFGRLYDERYSILHEKARTFFQRTDSTPEKSLIFVSAGFDACVYEYPSMQRHGKYVPPSFYHRFAQDTVRLAEQHAAGKVISLLEGGYSDRALTSAAIAHMAGLAGCAPEGLDWWDLAQLTQLEKALKKPLNPLAGSSGRGRKTDTSPAWLRSTLHTFNTLKAHLPGSAPPTEPLVAQPAVPAGPVQRVLRSATSTPNIRKAKVASRAPPPVESPPLPTTPKDETLSFQLDAMSLNRGS